MKSKLVLYNRKDGQKSEKKPPEPKYTRVSAICEVLQNGITVKVKDGKESNKKITDFDEFIIETDRLFSEHNENKEIGNHPEQYRIWRIVRQALECYDIEIPFEG